MLQKFISTASVFLAMSAVACSSSTNAPPTNDDDTSSSAAKGDGESKDKGAGDTQAPPAAQPAPEVNPLEACYPALGEYKTHYTRTQGDVKKCPDLADSTARVSAWSDSAEIPGCTMKGDKQTCTLTTECVEKSGAATTTQTVVVTLNKTGATGTMHTVTAGGSSPSDCTYKFTYSK
jgi:hypothetical protein